MEVRLTARSISSSWGRFQYLRGKAQWTIETFRSWVLPGSAAGAFVKYLGFSSRWSVAVAILLPVVVEFGGFLLGRFLWEYGGVEAEYQAALERDPYRRAQLEYQEAALKLQEKILAVEQQMAAALAYLPAIQRANEEALRMFTQILPAGADGKK